MNFDEAFARVLGHEGGYSGDSNDRGNWTSGEIGKGKLLGTKFGISAMSYPHLDIPGLTKDEAKAIYKKDFWDRVQGDELHAALAYQLFDAAVNHGTGTAIRLLQRALDMADDGRWGPLTRKRVILSNTDDTLKKFNAERIVFYTKLSTFPRYGRGWMRRVAENLKYAADDYTAPWYEHVEIAA